MKILAYEPNERRQELLEDFVLEQYRQQHHDLEVFPEPQDIDAALSAMPDIYDLVLMRLSDETADICAETIKTIKDRGDGTPIIMLAKDTSVESRLKCLEAGALCHNNPQLDAELLFTMRNVARMKVKIASPQITFGNFTLDTDTKTVSCFGQGIQLGRQEYQLLEYLAQSKGTPIPNERLFERITSESEDSINDNHLKQLISKLRTKLTQADPSVLTAAQEFVETNKLPNGVFQTDNPKTVAGALIIGLFPNQGYFLRDPPTVNRSLNIAKLLTVRTSSANTQDPRNIQFGNFMLSTNTQQLFCGQDEVLLPKFQYELLEILARHKGESIHWDVIVSQMNKDTTTSDATFRNELKHLRKALVQHDPSLSDMAKNIIESGNYPKGIQTTDNIDTVARMLIIKSMGKGNIQLNGSLPKTIVPSIAEDNIPTKTSDVDHRPLQTGPMHKGTVQIGPLAIDLDNQNITVNGQLLDMTERWHKTLELLATRKGQWVTHREIFDHAFFGNAEFNPKNISHVIAQIRQKIAEELCPDDIPLGKKMAQEILPSYQGKGYKLQDPLPDSPLSALMTRMARAAPNTALDAGGAFKTATQPPPPSQGLDTNLTAAHE